MRKLFTIHPLPLIIGLKEETGKRKLVKDRGDTIIEVLLSITIIAFVLGASYVLTNRSLQASIAAREHTEALNYLQGQVERLKSIKEGVPQATFDSTYRVNQPFCLYADPSRDDLVSKKLPGADNPDECAVDSNNPNGSGRYHLSITYIPASSSTNPKTFKLSAVWERIGTGTQESADIYYRTVNQ